MVTKLAELAIVVSLITLSQRLAGYENKPLGYCLLAVAVVAALYWLRELFLEKLATRGMIRTVATVSVSAILLALVVYPWVAGSETKTASTPPIPASSGPQTAAAEPLIETAKQLPPVVQEKGIQKKKPSMAASKQDSGISVGKDSVAMGHIPDRSKIGDGSVVIGATDAHGNTVLNQGGLAVGRGATADPTSIAIGAGAHAGGNVTVRPGGVASFGQQGGVTAGQVNVYGMDSGPIQVTARQDGNTITISTNRRIDSISLTLFFDAEIIGWSTSVQCLQRCIEGGRRNDSNGNTDLRTILTGWGQGFPTFTPDDPVQIHFSSVIPAKLVRLEWNPRPPF